MIARQVLLCAAVLLFLLACGRDGTRRSDADFGTASALVEQNGPVLRSWLDGNILTIRLENRGRQPIRIDRELVFLVGIGVVDSEGTGVDMHFVSALPKPSSGDLAKRFLLLPPGEVVERQIAQGQDFKKFMSAISWPTEQLQAYESLWRFPSDLRDVSEISVTYGPGYRTNEALESYVGLSVLPPDLYQGPLSSTIRLQKR